MSLNVVRRGAVFLSFTPHFLPLSDVRFFWHLGNPGAFLVAQLVKNLPEMQETWVWSLGWENPLENGMAIYSSIRAWRIPWTVQSMGSQRVRHNWTTFTSPHFYEIVGKGHFKQFSPPAMKGSISYSNPHWGCFVLPLPWLGLWSSELEGTLPF